MAADRKAINPLLRWVWELLSFYSNEEIIVPTTYHDQVDGVKKVLDSDISGVVNSILDFAINTASVDFQFETDNLEFTSLIENWSKEININLLGKVPVGLKALEKEYYRERWKNSSLLLLRTTWENVKVGNTTFYLPTNMWFVDGENIDIENNGEMRIIGEEDYFLKISENKKLKLPTKKNEIIFVQKPFNSWTKLYPIPFIIQRGIYKNLKFYEMINKKGERFVGKALEYLFAIKKGTENLAAKGDPNFIYDKSDLTKVKDDLKTIVGNNKSEGGTPIYATNFDTEMEHITPDYTKLVNSALFSPIEKRLLAGLGLVEIVEGVASTRREAILNPKPFISEVEQGIKDFSSLMVDILTTIKIKNQEKHPKYFGNKIELNYSPIKEFMGDNIREHLRSMYDRGVLSKQTYCEVVGELDIDIEVIRRKKELDTGIDELLYPQPIQNKNEIPAGKQNIEALNYKGNIEDEIYSGTDKEFLEALDEFSKVYTQAPYDKLTDLPPAIKKLSKNKQRAFKEAFNNALKKYKNETTAFKVAWSVVSKIKGEAENE